MTKISYQFNIKKISPTQALRAAFGNSSDLSKSSEHQNLKICCANLLSPWRNPGYMLMRTNPEAEPITSS